MTALDETPITTTEIRVTGRTFMVCIESSDVPVEEDWPEPVQTRVGRGWVFTYQATDVEREHICAHLFHVYENLQWTGDPETDRDDIGQDRAAIRRDLQRAKYGWW